jgi:hypothetical protein
MAISSKGSNIDKRHIPSEIDNNNPPPLLNTEDDKDNEENVEDVEIIESPAESADAELHEL